MTSPTSAALFTTAEQGIGLAANLGFEVPAGWTHAAECAAEARRILAEPEPQFDALPDDPGKLRPLIVKAAQARAAYTTMREIADAALDQAHRTAFVHFRNAVPGYVDQLVEQFNRVAAEFLAHRAQAADVISASDTDEQVAEHVAMTRAADRLDQLASMRLQFAASAGETGVHWSLPWHVLAPAAAGDTDRVQVCRDVLFELGRDHRVWQQRDPVARWTLLGHSGRLDMAPLGQIPARAATWSRVEAETPGDPAMTALGSELARRERANRLHTAAAAR